MSAKRNWLWGCGIGCGLLLLVAIAIPVVGGLLLSGSVEGFDKAVESREALEARFGTSESFEPWPTGTVPPERLETFLQVREASNPARARLTESFDSIFSAAAQAEDLDEKGVFEKLRFGLSVARKGAGMAPAIGTFFDVRNQALLDAEMGLGEYTYLYALAYYGLLGHSPDEGPGDKLDEIEGMEETDINVNGMDGSSRRVRRDLRTMLKSQLASLPETGEGEDPWRDALLAEIAALEKQRSRMPWQDGLPESLRASFEPFREQLESTYSATTNMFELSRNRKNGKFSFSTD